VATLVSAAQTLQKKNGLKCNVVSAISEGLFMEQSIDYREKLLPFGVPVFGLTAGLPVTLQNLAGRFGKVVGMQRFGASAPASVLDEKFGFTVDAVVREIETYLGEYKVLIGKLSKVLNKA
jgi:transketolase